MSLAAVLVSYVAKIGTRFAQCLSEVLRQGINYSNLEALVRRHSRDFFSQLRLAVTLEAGEDVITRSAALKTGYIITRFMPSPRSSLAARNSSFTFPQFNGLLERDRFVRPQTVQALDRPSNILWIKLQPARDEIFRIFKSKCVVHAIGVFYEFEQAAAVMNEVNVEKIPAHLHQLEPSVFRHVA